MALQLTGAAHRDSIANLQLRLPVVVIGGGLTAIDTATESLAYYSCRWRSSSTATRRWWRSAARTPSARAGTTRSARSPTSSWRTRGPSAPSGARRRRTGRAPRIVELLHSLGRRDHRLSQPSHRQPVVHAQPRGGRQGAGGGHPLRRGPDARRRRGRRVRRTSAALRFSRALGGDGDLEPSRPRDRACPRARCWSPPALSRTRCWRAKIRAHFPLDGHYFQACDEDGSRSSPADALRQARARATCCWRARRTGASSASSATCIRRSSATS